MLVLPWLFAIGFAIADEIVVGRLLRHLYTNHKSAWEAEGKPRGIFWIPEEAKVGRWYVTYASGHAGQLARWRWLFKSPEWINENADAPALMVLHRIFLSAFWVCAIAPFVMAAILQ